MVARVDARIDSMPHLTVDKLKAHLRRIEARTIDALWRAIGDICALHPQQECWNYLKEAGHVSDKTKRPML
ncbi:MAG: hypothetical protein EPO10_16420 [Reyranella sp.]|nr:MAG: hypothetical protein EPO41_11555 [Reyranella sp.]TBR27769.1 MAG: hypothetical protein EPO10_16420 [Reyranella sp.]